MYSIEKSFMLLALVFLIAGAGCAEQEKKAQERGKAVVDTVKEAEKRVDAAVSKMREKAKQIEQETK
ncbi:MAG: hypothetical protein ACE5GQ_03325 [Nitrospinales bacterium]